MLWTENSRGYCVEMICADFLAGASLESGNPEILPQSISRFFKFLPEQNRHGFFEQLSERHHETRQTEKATPQAVTGCVRRPPVPGTQMGWVAMSGVRPL